MNEMTSAQAGLHGPSVGADGIYRPLPPSPAERIVWPDAMGLRFALFVDVEEEFDWSRPLARANRSTGAMRALPAGHRVFTDAGLQPVYLVDHPVATDPASIDILAPLVAEGSAAIGAQLHPWVTPPFDEVVTPQNSFVGNLPVALEAAKIDTLGDAIEAAFGARPISFRAGRYGLGRNTLRLLEARGYALDSSMRSLYDYSGEGGPDYSQLDVGPFWCGPRRSMIELPLSSTFTGPLRGAGRALWREPYNGVLSRARLLGRVGLTPEDMPVADALEAIRVMAGDGVRLLSFSFHSPSLEPGHTPYVRDAADLVRFYRWWDAVFALLAKLGAAPIGLDGIIASARAMRR